MEQKAEELYEDGWCTSHPRPQFSVDEWVENGFKVYSKPVMFWKQSVGFKGSFRTGTSTIAIVPVQIKPYWTNFL